MVLSQAHREFKGRSSFPPSSAFLPGPLDACSCVWRGPGLFLGPMASLCPVKHKVESVTVMVTQQSKGLFPALSRRAGSAHAQSLSTSGSLRHRSLMMAAGMCECVCVCVCECVCVRASEYGCVCVCVYFGGACWVRASGLCPPV